MRRTEHYGKYQIMAGLIAAAILTGCAGAGGTVSETPAGAETTAQAATMAAEPSSETVTEKTVTEKEEAEAPVPARADTAAEAVAAADPAPEQSAAEESRSPEEIAAERAAAVGAVRLGDTGEDGLVFTFAGDLTFHTGQNPGAQEAYDSGIRSCFDQEALDIMDSADVFVVNNEFQYTDGGSPLEGKKYTFRCSPYTAEWLQEIGVDLVTLANNHIFDFGEEGFLDTLDTLSEIGMPYIGAGYDLEDAVRPAYYEADGMIIAVLNATEIERYENPDTRGASEDAGGVFRCLDSALLCEKVREAKEKADYVIVTIHWGTERMETPDELQIQHAIDLEEAGCDMIIGGHPHVLQTISWYEDMPIIYSLGNYFFSFDTRNTGVVQVSFDTGNKSLKSLRFVPMVQSYGLYTLEGEEKAGLLEYMRSISPKVEIDDDGYVTKRDTE